MAGQARSGRVLSASTEDWSLIFAMFSCRLFDGEHYFLLEDEGEGTKLRHGENFSGLFTAGFITRGFTYAFHFKSFSPHS